jgi:hypothetical protein
MEDITAVRIEIASVDFIGYLIDRGACKWNRGMRIPFFGFYGKVGQWSSFARAAADTTEACCAVVVA